MDISTVLLHLLQLMEPGVHGPPGQIVTDPVVVELTPGLGNVSLQPHLMEVPTVMVTTHRSRPVTHISAKYLFTEVGVDGVGGRLVPRPVVMEAAPAGLGDVTILPQHLVVTTVWDYKHRSNGATGNHVKSMVPGATGVTGLHVTRLVVQGVPAGAGGVTHPLPCMVAETVMGMIDKPWSVINKPAQYQLMVDGVLSLDVVPVVLPVVKVPARLSGSVTLRHL